MYMNLDIRLAGTLLAFCSLSLLDSATLRAGEVPPSSDQLCVLR